MGGGCEPDTQWSPLPGDIPVGFWVWFWVSFSQLLQLGAALIAGAVWIEITGFRFLISVSKEQEPVNGKERHFCHNGLLLHPWVVQKAPHGGPEGH